MTKKITTSILLLTCFTLFSQKPRARDLGIQFDGITGKYNAITDVQGVAVGHSTIISGEGENKLGKGPVRTGVTAVFPSGKKKRPLYANWYSLNGNGEMTGTTWITESGFLETPIMLTNSFSVGTVSEATLKWMVNNSWSEDDWWWTFPVVAETYDGFLNDIYGFKVKEEHVLAAINNTSQGFVEEGNVGGGTGMISFGFKAGIGTSSRILKFPNKDYTVGVLVQSNFGDKSRFRIDGVPIGKELKDTLDLKFNAPPKSRRKNGDGSIIVIVATDAPLLPYQLKRIVHRVPIGIGKLGGIGSNGSGDIFIAFSTANKNAYIRKGKASVETLSNDWMNDIFEATIQAVEEAVINAMVSAETMEGINGNKAYALPKKKLIEIMKKYNRIK
ncbi:L-aminopeptidase/D-esterase [Polaribacter sp. Hel1_33_78]|jgi:D-aminopeptidase|uniref:DmpA family aminopeptidase n=1 Tax=Polaribacter sp. Hel1_33_78 TaxID=1336804 RepID=UPI00087BD0D5|nr:P1 family peptidase [Polaribacter sp. Hel1_33_78]SDU12125.1 L-aminopeptidase/D-esterase [Polaribacter sp. Hel1_33_78]